VVADTELAPSQRRALEDIVGVKVIDRTAVILDIFSQHATSREGQGSGRARPARVPPAATARVG
jgi:50S ribosomal subunit-associated GTPase HflX